MVSILTVVFFLFLVLIITVLAIFWKDIMVFFNPQDYNKIEMEEKDGNVKVLTMKKNKDLTFKFREGIYFMFFVDKQEYTEDGVLVPPVYDPKPQLRMKRVGLFRYKEGYSYPIRDNVVIDSDANYNLSQLEQKFTDLFFEKSLFNEDIFKWVMIGCGVLIVLVILYGVFFKQAPPQV